MKHLLSSPDGAGALAQLAATRTLVAFDFDGTLAPIVANRGRAEMRPRTAELLSALGERFPCAVISGRGRDDVLARLAPVAIKHVVGNHGLEPGANLEAFEAEVHEVIPSLQAGLAGLPGVELEDKRYSLAIHFRGSPTKLLARAAILEAAAALPVQMRVVHGRLVVNLIPARAPNKGAALLALRSAEHADIALYVGDDITDEDVFTIDQPGRLLSVRVGECDASAAAYYLRDQGEVDDLLTGLIALRDPRPAA